MVKELYHGTNAVFERFNEMSYFTDQKPMARYFAKEEGYILTCR